MNQLEKVTKPELIDSAPRGLSTTDKDNYNTGIKLFNRWNQGKEFNADSFVQFFSELKKGIIRTQDGHPYSGASVALFKSALKAGLKATVGRGLTVHAAALLDPMFKQIKTPKPDKKVYRDEILTHDEIEELVAKSPLKKGAFMSFLYMSGLRISEAINVRLSHCKIDKDLVYIRIPLGKGMKERRVKVERDTFDKTKKAFQSEEFLIHNQRSKDGSYSRKYWFREVRRQGLGILGREIGCHTFRHSNATSLLANGASLEAVRLHLGHSRASTTCVYIHDELELEQIKKLSTGGRGNGKAKK